MKGPLFVCLLPLVGLGLILWLGLKVYEEGGF